MSSTLPTHQSALVITNFNSDFSLEQRPIPQIPENGVLVKNLYASVNPIDYKVKAGYAGYSRMVQSFPHVLGVDACGLVVAVGDKVTKVKVGQHVVGFSFSGTYSQYVLFKEEHVAVKPSNIPTQNAASIGVTFLTAFQALKKLSGSSNTNENSLNGKKILIIGGSVGAAAILLAKHYFNASEVITTTSTKNVEFVKGLGADLVLDYSILGKDLLSEELQAHEGTFDLVFDTVGTYQDYYSIPLLKHDNSVHVTIATQLPKEGNVFGSANHSFLTMSASGELLSQILNWLEESALYEKIPLSILKLEQAEEAHKLSASQRTVGKIVLEIPNQN